MLLTNHDLHDLHAVFVILRAHPSDPESESAVRAVKAIIDAPQTDNTVPPNILRSGLSAISSLDRGMRNRPRAVKRDITREISYCYRSRWNKDFLKALL